VFSAKGTVMASEVEIVLIGASIGKSWNFDKLPERKNLKKLNLEYIGVFDTFDKSPAIEEVLNRKNKPSVVIIKQCSVFFPGDITNYKKMTQEWVGKLRNNKIIPVLATSAPFAEPETVSFKVKKVIKNILGYENRYEQIVEFNDWVRSYSDKEGLSVLDLELALRVSNDNRHLNPKYDIGDHVHLNQTAYESLDQLIVPVLQNIKSELRHE